MTPKQPSNPSQTIGIIAALLILVGLGGTYQFLNPNLNLAATNYAQAKAQDDGLQTDINTLQAAQTKVDVAKHTLSDAGLDFNSLANIFPATEEIPNLYIQMEYLMGSTPNVVSSYQVSPPVSNTPGDVRIPLTFAATGTYSSLKDFIVTLENNIRPVTITALSFGPAATKDQNGKPVKDAETKLTVNISGYVRSQSLSSAYTTSKK